jgi:hypothetical protein
MTKNEYLESINELLSQVEKESTLEFIFVLLRKII